MANVKITALAQLFSNALSNVDVVPIVDISESETKRIKLVPAISTVAHANDFATYTILSADINTVSDNVDSVVTNLDSFGNYSNTTFATFDYVDSNNTAEVETRRADNTFYSYNTHSVSTSANIVSTANSDLGSISFPWDTTFTGTVNLGEFQLQQTHTANVSVSGATIFSKNKNSFNCAKLIVNIKDLTYGQFQASEILLVHDNSVVRLTEYAIVHTSTNPIATFEADYSGDNVELVITAQSTDNMVTVLQFIN